jgi:hypothetical protein
MLKRTKRRIAGALIIILIHLPACAASQARQMLVAFQEHGKLNTAGWVAARDRLKAMCPPLPSTVEEYERGRASRQMGADPFRGCDVRVIKLTNSPRTDDWEWAWVPPYQTIVAIHEEELRKRVIPKLYEEYLLGVSRYLAEKTDQGEITRAQMMAAFNASWLWMIGKIQEQVVLLLDGVRAADQADAAAWSAFSAVAAGLAIVTVSALVAGATSRATTSAPVVAPPSYTSMTCQAVPGFRNTITGQLYSVNVYCR